MTEANRRESLVNLMRASEEAGLYDTPHPQAPSAEIVRSVKENCQCYQRPSFATPPCPECKAAERITDLQAALDGVRRLARERTHYHIAGLCSGCDFDSKLRALLPPDTKGA